MRTSHFVLLSCLTTACAAATEKADPAPADTAHTGQSPSTGCNGHDALCDRRVTEVTFAGTHNSMSNADAGWIAPNQRHGLTRQLEDGVRALMLDTHEWEGDLYLCHAYCDLGAQLLVEGLAELTVFLDAHPREVVQIIFQDAIAIEDTRRALTEAGLADRLYVWTDRSDPTLQELIDAGTTLIVGLESGASDAAGLQGAWDLWTDTPYSFSEPEDFSCERNRGADDNALFLVNHWIGNPLPSEAESAAVNARAVLLDRARSCAEARGRPVNFLGVDFYNVGDLFDVVDTLNGVSARR